MSDERQFAPTPQRREQARQEGRLPRGADVTAMAVLLSGLLGLWCGGPWLMGQLQGLMRTLLANPIEIAIHPDGTRVILQQVMLTCGLILLPGLAAIWLVAGATQIGQVGWNFRPQRLAPDLQRVNPLEGLARLTNRQRWVDGGLVAVRMLIVLGVGLAAIWQGRNGMVPQLNSPAGLGRIWPATFNVLLPVTLAMMILAIVEFGYRWWQHEASLYMTAEESRQHAREQEGDLRVQALRNSLHEEIRQKSTYRPHATTTPQPIQKSS